MSNILLRLYREVLLYDGLGVAVRSRVVTAGGGDPLAIAEEATVRGDGQERVVSASPVFEFHTADPAFLAQVRLWVAASTPVYGLTLGVGLLAQWEEPVVPRILDRPTEGLSLDGPTIRLSVTRRGAAVYRHEDLLYLAEWAASGDLEAASRVLPAPGMTVYAAAERFGSAVEVEAISFYGSVLASGTVTLDADSDGYYVPLTLPAGTWTVRVTSAEHGRATLTTAPRTARVFDFYADSVAGSDADSGLTPDLAFASLTTAAAAI